MGVLFLNLVTQEWSHGTGLLTFSIERKRGRIIAAKLTATLLIGLMVLVILLITAFTVTLMQNLIFDKSITYATNGNELLDIIRVFATNMLLAFAFGLALRNAALSIVLYFIISPLTIILGQLPQIGEYASWLSLGHSSSLFIAGYQSQGTAQMCISTFLWIALPLLIGLYLNSEDYQER